MLENRVGKRFDKKLRTKVAAFLIHHKNTPLVFETFLDIVLMEQLYRK